MAPGRSFPTLRSVLSAMSSLPVRVLRAPPLGSPPKCPWPLVGHSRRCHCAFGSLSAHGASLPRAPCIRPLPIASVLRSSLPSTPRATRL
eukprot:10224223-Alexandrium_andersonii.AAC.1